MQLNHTKILLLAIMIFGLNSCTTTTSTQGQEMALRPESTIPIRVEEDIQYKEGRTLDVFAPEEEARWPIVILLHGGGVNNKSLAELSSSIASHGAIVISPTWTSNPPQASYITKGWDEVVCSMRFAQSYASEKGLVNARTIIIGHSAGGASGFVALLAAEEFTGECLSNENPIRVDAFIGLDGAYNILDHVPTSRLEEGNLDEWERINPYHYLDKTHFRENVGITMVTGSVDELETIAANFKGAVEKAGYTVNHIRLPERDHWGVATPYQDVLEIIMNVLYTN